MVWSGVQGNIPVRFDCNPGPSLTEYSNSIATSLDAFLSFFDEKVLEIIVKNTNKHAQGDISWIDLTSEELMAYLGVLVVVGITKSKKRSLESLWSTEHFFNTPFYNTVFSRDRFKSISSHLRFDDTSTRDARIKDTGDKLQAVREMSEALRECCIKAYNPSKYMTVDERLQAFRGKFFGKVYMSSKPGKFGIKFWIICDAQNSYVHNFQVYFPGKCYMFLLFFLV